MSKTTSPHIDIKADVSVVAICHAVSEECLILIIVVMKINIVVESKPGLEFGRKTHKTAGLVAQNVYWTRRYFHKTRIKNELLLVIFS